MGRRPKYDTEEARQAARRENFKKGSKAYAASLASEFVRRTYILSNDLAGQLDAYCSGSERNSSDVVTSALKSYLKKKI